MEYIDTTASNDKYLILCSCDVCLEKQKSMKGWECPKCGLVNSPYVSFCPCSKMSFSKSCCKENSIENNAESQNSENEPVVFIRTDIQNKVGDSPKSG